MKCECGWVYSPEKTGKEFLEESSDYKCTECGADKSSFSPVKEVNEDDLLGRLDSYLVGEKSNKVFPIDTLKKVQKLTSQNDHNGARVLVTKTIKNRKMQSAYEGIEKLHEFFGDMPPSLNETRQAIDKMLFDFVKQNYSNGQDVYMAM